MGDYKIFPDREIGRDIAPLCMSVEDFYLWLEAAETADCLIDPMPTVCADCTPEYKEKAGNLCQNKDVKFVWREIPEGNGLRELIGTNEPRDSDITASSSQGAFGGFRYFDRDCG